MRKYLGSRFPQKRACSSRLASKLPGFRPWIHTPTTNIVSAPPGEPVLARRREQTAGRGWAMSGIIPSPSRGMPSRRRLSCATTSSSWRSPTATGTVSFPAESLSQEPENIDIRRNVRSVPSFPEDDHGSSRRNRRHIRRDPTAVTRSPPPWGPLRLGNAMGAEIITTCCGAKFGMGFIRAASWTP